MLLAVTPDSVDPLVKQEGNFVISDFLGDHQDPERQKGFQAYLVEQRVHELRPHFHEVDQFQVVVGGSGSLGREPMTAGVVHYTQGYTSYGPILTEEGVDYFTLRATPTTGINYMPEERRKRAEAGGGGEHFTTAVPLASDADGVHLLETSPRGARAYSCRLPADEELCSRLPEDAEGEGYVVVLGGALQSDGTTLPPRTVLAFSDMAELGGLSAVDQSAVLALMTFALR